MSRDCKGRWRTAIFAHRGFTGALSDAAPSDAARSGAARSDAARPVENTIEAFVAAHRAGADGVELDVRLTSDAEPAVHHDPELPGLGSLTNMLAADLPAHVPLLAGVFDALETLGARAGAGAGGDGGRDTGSDTGRGGGMAVNVEIKHEDGTDPDRRLAAAVADVLNGRRGRARGAGGGVGRILVSSFDPESLREVRRLAPGVPTGLLVDWHTDARAGLEAAVALGAATLHPFVTQVDPGLVDAARQAGLGLHVWTVNADADLEAMAALGVDAVITDRVTAAVAILRSCGRDLACRNGEV